MTKYEGSKRCQHFLLLKHPELSCNGVVIQKSTLVCANIRQYVVDPAVMFDLSPLGIQLKVFFVIEKPAECFNDPSINCP